MGNHSICSGAPQQCVDECARLQFETRSRDAEDPDCDPAGTIFNETLQGLVSLDKEALRFAGTSNLSAVRWLLSMGASVKARDRNGTTMLHASCRSGSCLIVQELVRKGLPLDAQDSSGWTPLHIAAVMGRRDLALLLVRVRANVAVKNKKGATPGALCSDPGTKEVLEEFSTETNVVRPHPKPCLADMLIANPGGNHDDYTATCEPFFVPRLPLCHNEAHRAEVIHLGLELFKQSAGHGLAFFVATGVVHDHPTDLSSFLLKHHVDPVQLGKFLGEEFSLAQTLRLAFIHSVDVTNTGVVGALLKAFRQMRAPLDLGKIDRLTSAVAHLWWRTHDGGDWADELGDEDLDWTMFAEDPIAVPEERPKVAEEVVGQRLRAAMRTVEGLRRLMFSTVMLCWNLHRAARVFEGAVSPRRMSLAGWLDMNLGIEVDGSNLPIHVQKGIYQTVMEPGRMSALLPLDRESAPTASTSSAAVSPALTPLAVQDSSLLVKGWASIPRGGLERHEPIAGGTGPRIANCVFSEASSSHPQLPPGFLAGQPPPQSHAEEGEAVWLTLRLSLFLFLATSPSEAAPYAFVRLQDAVLRDMNRQNRHLILAGRPKSGLPLGVKARAGQKPGLPFGDATRLPLPLCFLLADGRFQPFEALWLELQFSSDEDFDLWARELGMACEGPPCASQVELRRPLNGSPHSGGSGPSPPRVLGGPLAQPRALDTEPTVASEESAAVHEGPRPAG